MKYNNRPTNGVIAIRASSYCDFDRNTRPPVTDREHEASQESAVRTTAHDGTTILTLSAFLRHRLQQKARMWFAAAPTTCMVCTQKGFNRVGHLAQVSGLLTVKSSINQSS